jgi:aldehyde:ferredoxin oxidoreductase
MVSCLFARGVYTDARLSECLKAVGYQKLAEDIALVSRRVQSERWKLRFATGYDPDTVEIPKRFSDVVTWKGPIDGSYLSALKTEYGRRTRSLAAEAARAGGADAGPQEKTKKE